MGARQMGQAVRAAAQGQQAQMWPQGTSVAPTSAAMHTCANPRLCVCVCVCVCVCACARARVWRVSVRVRACVCVCARVRAHV